MTKKLNSMPDYQARMPRQPHDTSRAIAYTACPSMLLPTYYDMLHLGDEVFFQATQFSRLNPLVTAALADIDIHIDYFFVPLSVIYTPAPSLFYQTDDLISSNFVKSDSEFLGHFPRYDIDNSLANQMYDLDSTAGHANDAVPYYQDTTAHTLPTTGFDCKGKSYHRILDMFGYAADAVISYNITGFDSNLHWNPVTTPWFLCAYQACYQKYFRNDDREPINYHYNLDKQYNQASFIELNNQKPLYALNYRSRYKDYFTSVKVSPIASSVSMLSAASANGGVFQPPRFLDAQSVKALTVGASDTPVSSATQTGYSTSSNRITTNGIRKMFAFEKLLRIIGRAEKNYESQFLAHFGVKIPHDVMHNITHIGHDMATLRPEPVISKADTYNTTSGDGSALGEIGGQGQIKFTGRQRSFKAPCHGVFLVIVSHQPRFRYLHGVDKLHDLDVSSKFWQPEYDKLGMQPQFLYESYAAHFKLAVGSDRVGWQFRYEQFKRKYDTITSAFANPEPNYNVVNTYSPWVLSRKFLSFWNQTGYYMPETYPHILLGSPNDLNGLMQVPHETTWSNDFALSNPWLLYQTDPFICDFNLHCKKVNFMSEYGEPEL